MTALDDLARRFDTAALAIKYAAKDDDDNRVTDRDASNLRGFWTQGEGAAVIEWDTPGALDRCEVLISKYPIRNPAALCRSYFETVHGHTRYHEDQPKPAEDGDGAA